jgi:hypothetical protein
MKLKRGYFSRRNEFIRRRFWAPGDVCETVAFSPQNRGKMTHTLASATDAVALGVVVGANRSAHVWLESIAQHHGRAEA